MAIHPTAPVQVKYYWKKNLFSLHFSLSFENKYSEEKEKKKQEVHNGNNQPTTPVQVKWSAITEKKTAALDEMGMRK